MKHPRVIDPAAPLATRLTETLLYPLRGQSLAAVVALAIGLAISKAIGLVPFGGVILGLESLFLWVVVWVAAYLYALGCLQHTADGWAEPPEIKLETGTTLALLLFLLYRFHERMGHQPEADTLAMATGRDHDAQLLSHVRSLQSVGNKDSAFTLLKERLQQSYAPWAIHAEFRKLARACGYPQALLDTTPSALACLMASSDWRRALALVQENIDIQPDYMPPEAAVAGALAEQAANMGMNRLALKLARGYPNTWPRDPEAPRYGLLAAQLLAERLDHPAEAGVLASKLLLAFPDCPQHDAIQKFLDRLSAPQARKSLADS